MPLLSHQKKELKLQNTQNHNKQGLIPEMLITAKFHNN
jgi:hypothetical protein